MSEKLPMEVQTLVKVTSAVSQAMRMPTGRILGAEKDRSSVMARILVVDLAAEFTTSSKQDLADFMGCSLVSIYDRIKVLRAMKDDLDYKRLRSEAVGFMSAESEGRDAEILSALDTLTRRFAVTLTARESECEL